MHRRAQFRQPRRAALAWRSLPLTCTPSSSSTVAMGLKPRAADADQVDAQRSDRVPAVVVANCPAVAGQISQFPQLLTTHFQMLQ
jgi:hypothetical protein